MFANLWYIDPKEHPWNLESLRKGPKDCRTLTVNAITSYLDCHNNVQKFSLKVVENWANLARPWRGRKREVGERRGGKKKEGKKKGREGGRKEGRKENKIGKERKRKREVKK